ncbi:hypothetical protein [Gallintestinimicrobium sp.]|uniref:hypothetical protein n=1 Tax=Gallintestinimicrobium sp. TaxID=2981655 RepID=UPI0039939C12
MSVFVLLQLAGFAYAIAMNTFVFEKVSDELNRRLADAMVRIEYFDLEKKEKAGRNLSGTGVYRG